MPAVGAIDQGTTGTKALVLSTEGRLEVAANLRHRQIHPRPGWVEHDAGEFLARIQEAGAAFGEVAAVGLANQGETAVAWDADGGQPLYNAIVWQDKRTCGLVRKPVLTPSPQNRSVSARGQGGRG